MHEFALQTSFVFVARKFETMSGGIYGGDEVGALVFDFGSHTVRAGYAGDEYPKLDIPSVVGVQDNVDLKDENGEVIGKGRKTFIGTTKVTVPREGCEVKTFMKDCMVEDWDLFENMLDHIYSHGLGAQSEFHPALFTEPAWNDRAKREKLCEIMFEKYKLPAFHLVKNAVLTAFANGRTHGLIVDSGATHTSAVPVFEGYCITHSVVRSPVGGDLIVEQLNKLLAQHNIDLIPTYRIASKEEVSEGEAPKWTEKKNLPNVTKTYDDYMKKLILEDVSMSILQCCDAPVDEEFAEKLPSAPYSFPNGLIKEFLAERVKVPEGLFDLNYLKDHPHKDTLQNICQIANTSCGMCEPDMKSHLYSNLVVTGGNSLLLGFSERLNHDLAHKCPPIVKLRVSAAPTAMERRFGAWIGGSIVASLGSFQQMWVSRAEYDESGCSIVEKKCP